MSQTVKIRKGPSQAEIRAYKAMTDEEIWQAKVNCSEAIGRILAEIDAMPRPEPEPAPPKPVIERKHTLYRQYDKDGVLLYVGISFNTARRNEQHRKYSWWFQEVATIKVEHYESLEEVQRLEKEAIKTEKPKYNIKHAVW